MDNFAERSFSFLFIPAPALQLRKPISLLLLIISWCTVERSPGFGLRSFRGPVLYDATRTHGTAFKFVPIMWIKSDPH